MRGFPNAFWLPGEYHLRKVSYAASSRSELSRMPLDMQSKLHQYLNDFCYIGSRDDSTIYEVNKFLEEGKNAHFNPDPVFSWNFGDLKAQEREILKKKFGVSEDEKVLGLMVTKRVNASIIIQKAKQLGYTPIALYKRYSEAKNALLDPFEWIAVISALDGFVTSFFHGMCFAIKYDTPFVAFEERKTSNEHSKMYDLAKRIGCQERFITENQDVGDAIASHIVDNTIDFSAQREELYERFLCSVKEIKESIM
jgi:hypothetical protein